MTRLKMRTNIVVGLVNDVGIKINSENHIVPTLYFIGSKFKI